MKVLQRKVALEIHRLEIFLYAYPAELINADSTKETRQSPVGKQVQWPGVLVLENSPEGIMISEYAYARIRILTLRVRWK